MTAPQTIGAIDLLGEADLSELAHHDGPAHVSLFMPAHRAGPDTRQDPIRFTIAELDPGPIPTSMAEALAHEDPEAQLQFGSGGESGMFHGHGEGDEVDKQRVERYLRAVDHGLVERIGAGRRTPLVLASVGHYLAIYAGGERPPGARRARGGGQP